MESIPNLTAEHENPLLRYTCAQCERQGEEMYCDYHPLAGKGRHSYRSRRVVGSTQAYRLILRPNHSDLSSVEQLAHRHKKTAEKSLQRCWV